MKNKTFATSLGIACLLLVYSCQKTTVPSKQTEPAPVPTVNAGPSQTITLPVDSVLLSGSAHDSASKITAYSWSELSGPNTLVLTADTLATVEIRGLVAGTYVFQLQAADSLGATAVDTMMVTVVNNIKPLGQTDTLRTFFSGVSTPYEYTVYNNDPIYGNGGTLIELMAMTWTVSGNTVPGRSFFKFNLTGIPAGTTVKSAMLQLFSDTLPKNGNLIDANSGSNNDFYIQRNGSDWSTSTINWSNQPAPDSVGEAYIPQTSQSFLNLSVDVTTMVNNMLTSGNYGFSMRLNTETPYNCRLFCSSIYSDSTRHPYLVVTY